MGRLQAKDSSEIAREAKELQEELELEEADLAQLRNEADLVLKQKQQWEMQLEVSRSCIQKLEARLVKTRRAKADGKFGTNEVDKRLLRELEELVKQRDRLCRESEALGEQAEEHDREVQAFVHVLKALPQARVNAAVLKQEVLVAEEEIDAYHQRLPLSDFGMERHKELQEELLQCQVWGEETAQQQESCERQARELQEEMARLAAEAGAAKQEELAAKEEAASRKVQCAECSMAFRKQQVTKAHLLRQVRELEATLARARGDVAAEQAEQKSTNAKLEARCRSLREEVEENVALRSRAIETRNLREAETVELEESTARMALQLHADQEAQAQIQAALHSSLRFAERQEAELRAQELVGEALVEEVMQNHEIEEALRRELRHERHEAQEASNAALALLSKRQLKADEAREALLQCNDALFASQRAEEELLRREGQLEQSARSSQKMHETLLQRLSTVHDKVKTAESAHAHALEELQAERREQSRLSQQLLLETSKQRSRVALSAPANGRGQRSAQYPCIPFKDLQRMHLHFFIIQTDVGRRSKPGPPNFPESLGV